MNETNQPAQAGREKCKAFCGMTAGAISRHAEAEREYRLTPFEPDLWHFNRRYCTPACRDARLSPIAPPTPAPAREVKVGQRRRNARETFTVYAIVGEHAIVCQVGQVDPVTHYVHRGDDSCCWESIAVLEDCEIVGDGPTPARERRAGQRWRSVSMSGSKPYVVEGTLLRREDFGGTLGPGWHIVDAIVNGKPREDGRYVFYDKTFASDREFVLLAEGPATSEPGRAETTCEPWCGEGLPPDGVCGYGFVDEPGRDLWRFTLPGETQRRRKGYVISWCSVECRERAIAANGRTVHPSLEGLRAFSAAIKGPAMPAQEAAKADPKCGSCVKPHPTVMERVRKGGRMWLCEPCMLAAESDQWSLMAFGSTGKPYKGPARLPRPKLAHVAGMHDDDLIGGGR